MVKTILTLLFSLLLLNPQDVVEISPKDYKVVAEDPHVRIIQINAPAGAQTPMHSHPDSLVVILAPSILEHTEQSGKISKTPPSLKRGDVAYAPQVTHSMQQLGDTTFKAFQIELKEPTQATSAEPSPGTAFKTVLDNTRVKVFDTTLRPGESIQEPQTPHINVLLAEGSIRRTSSNGKRSVHRLKTDLAIMESQGNGAISNIGKMPVRLLIVNIK